MTHDTPRRAARDNPWRWHPSWPHEHLSIHGHCLMQRREWERDPAPPPRRTFAHLCALMREPGDPVPHIDGPYGLLWQG